jgi:uncharacterized protein YkwD
MKKYTFLEYLRKKEDFEQARRAGQKFLDSDNDGLTDFEEINIYGTDPHNPDSDNDGVSDGDEVMMDRNPLGEGSLRNLFIPCSQNDYSPQILKPRRIIFHIVSLLAIKLILVLFVVFYPLSAWLSPDVSLNEARKVIDLTNNIRKELKLEVLTENGRLTQAAWQKVQDMLINQYFAHLNPTGQDLSYWINKNGYKYSVIGENLAMGYATAEDVVSAWSKSPTHYKNIINRNFKETGVAIGDGRFKNTDTVFMAQYFARPKLIRGVSVNLPITPAVIDNTKNIKQVATTTKIVKGDILYSIESDDEIKTGTIAIKKDATSDVKVIKTEVSLSPETISATAIISGKNIELNKDPVENNWSGVAIIDSNDEKNILSPLVPATLVVEDNTSQINNYQLDWSEVTPIKTSVWEKYFLFKQSPSNIMLPVLIFSNFYFKILLVIFSLAAVLNIIIEIKKQKLRLIISSCSLICLLVILILF